MTLGQNNFAVRNGLCFGGCNQNGVAWIASEVKEKKLLCDLNRFFLSPMTYFFVSNNIMLFHFQAFVPWQDFEMSFR